MATPEHRLEEEQVAAALGAVRALDPAIGSDAMRRFLLEVAEMDAALDAIAADDAPLLSGYTPRWPEEPKR